MSNFMERQFINVISSRLRKQLKKDVDGWFLVLDYKTKELFFKVGEDKYSFGDSVTIIKDYLADKYDKYEKENNLQIIFVIVSSSNLNVKLVAKNDEGEIVNINESI